MKTLESIQGSTIHQNMVRLSFQMPICPTFKGINQDIYMKPYYEQMKKLEAIKPKFPVVFGNYSLKGVASDYSFFLIISAFFEHYLFQF